MKWGRAAGFFIRVMNVLRKSTDALNDPELLYIIYDSLIKYVE